MAAVALGMRLLGLIVVASCLFAGAPRYEPAQGRASTAEVHAQRGRDALVVLAHRRAPSGPRAALSPFVVPAAWAPVRERAVRVAETVAAVRGAPSPAAVPARSRAPPVVG